LQDNKEIQMSQLNASIRWKAGLVIVLLVFTACQRNGSSSAPGLKITGELKGLRNKTIRLVELDVKTVKPIDSVIVGEDGKFSFELKPEGSSIYLVTWLPAQKLILVADSGENIHIEANSTNLLNNASIRGSEASSWLLDFERYTSQNLAKTDSLSELFLSSRSDPGFAGIRQHLDSVYTGILNRQRLYMERFIIKHPSSLASLIVLNHKFGPNLIFTEEKDASYFIKVDSGLMERFPGNKHTIDHHNRVAALIKKQNHRLATDSLLMPGNHAPDVRLNNAEGKPFSLSSLKGKVVLIYFWAAMDGKSRKFIRNLIPIYKTNRNKGFEIYGVGMEPNRSLWLNAIKLDKPGGVQVNAESGSEEMIADHFGIETLPEALLIDRQGKISVRGISLDELRRKLPVQLKLK
jgi:hypothetical protein